MYRYRLTCTAFALLAALTWSTIATATTFLFTATLDGLQETPPNASPGSGVGGATLDDTSGLFTVTAGTSYTGLLAPSTAAHLHQAAPGVPGPVILPLTHSLATSGMLSGSGILTAAQIAAVIAGDSYFNIHTSVFPGGEIRGQLVPVVVPEPSSLVLVSLAGLGFLAAARRRRW